MIIYPIADKELYLDPYISMLLRLNRELEAKNVWVVVGYSFNDPIVREIFIRKSSEEKHLILVHPEATDICNKRLAVIRDMLSPIEKYFGLSTEDLRGQEMSRGSKKEEYNKVNHQILHKLKDNLRFGWADLVVPQ